MRILMCGRGYDGLGHRAVGNFEWDQARALKAAGHDVRFAAIDTRSLLHARPLAYHSYELEGIPVYYASVPFQKLPFGLDVRPQEKAAAIVWRHIRKIGWRPEIIHCHFGGAFLVIARENGIPGVYTEHYSGSNTEDIAPEELQRERETYPLANRVLCVSYPQAEMLRRHTGCECEVVHNIVDTAVFRPGTGERHEPFGFVATGNLIHRKGFDLLLKAFAALKEEEKSASTLTVIGGGEEETNLRTLADSLGITERVRFLGRQPRELIAEEYLHADAFALASRLETFGVVYIEAMAAGLPVIATACRGPEDFVDASNGILIPTENVPALTEAMRKMMRTRKNYRPEAISASVRERFSPEAMTERLTGVYESLIHG